jgi:molybdopterin-guanine dinucleotide biosynthesis protein A
MYHRRMDALFADTAAFVLAGGQSTRMGSDKAFVVLHGQTLLARALEVARSVTNDVWIVGSPEKFAAFAPVVEDVFRDCGPLGGIHAALRASRAELNLVLAVDMPFASRELLRYLVTRARGSDGIATVAREGENWQPLCAVYRREFADIAESALRAGRYKIDALFAAINMQVVTAAEIARVGFASQLFRNLNSIKDLESAQDEG